MGYLHIRWAFMQDVGAQIEERAMTEWHLMFIGIICICLMLVGLAIVMHRRYI